MRRYRRRWPDPPNDFPPFPRQLPRPPAPPPPGPPVADSVLARLEYSRDAAERRAARAAAAVARAEAALSRARRRQMEADLAVGAARWRWGRACEGHPRTHVLSI